jgi:hypothetical protein
MLAQKRIMKDSKEKKIKCKNVRVPECIAFSTGSPLTSLRGEEHPIAYNT